MTVAELTDHDARYREAWLGAVLTVVDAQENGHDMQEAARRALDDLYRQGMVIVTESNIEHLKDMLFEAADDYLNEEWL